MEQPEERTIGRRRAAALIGAGLLLAAAGALTTHGCLARVDNPDLRGVDVRLTLLHTSDIHSRILPFDHAPMYTEQKLGLVPGRGPYGGLARVAHIVKRERERAGRSLYLDSGDLFQGAPIFNLFHGEPEIRALSAAGVDAFALGNHEFDVGAVNVADRFLDLAAFPVLAANYEWERNARPFADEFDDLVDPWIVFNVHGLRVGVIGMGNLSSMTSLEEGGNSLGIVPREVIETVQHHVSMLRDQVDLVLLLSHLGLGEDEKVARNVCGLDVILGGHHHVALDPPKVIPFDPDPEFLTGTHEDGYYDVNEDGSKSGVPAIANCSGEHRRAVIMSHPNAFAKFVGRLDLVIRDGRVRSHSYRLFPVDSTVPDDPEVADLLEDYERELALAYDLDRVITTATGNIRRFGVTGGDSPLGNLVAEAMQTREHVETDFAVTNSLGIRTDILEGDVTVETMFNVLPFENTIATMFLSGSEVRELLDYATRRAAGRGCASQVQVSGMTFTMNCRTGEAEGIRILGQPLEPDAVYEMATNNYMAWGGSGFEMLKRNTTKKDTGIAIRAAVTDYLEPLEAIPACLAWGDDGQCLHGIGYADGRIRPAY